MNILIKEIWDTGFKRCIHKVINSDTGEEIKGLQSVDYHIDCSGFPQVIMRGIGNVEFEGQVNLKIIKEKKDDK